GGVIPAWRCGVRDDVRSVKGLRPPSCPLSCQPPVSALRAKSPRLASPRPSSQVLSFPSRRECWPIQRYQPNRTASSACWRLYAWLMRPNASDRALSVQPGGTPFWPPTPPDAARLSRPNTLKACAITSTLLRPLSANALLTRMSTAL